MRKNYETTVHEPRLVVPEACLEKCGSLRKLAGEATRKAINHPDDQYAVECGEKRSIFCGGQVLTEGYYDNFGDRVENSEKCFLANPARQGEFGKTPDQIIENAEANGAEEFSLKQL